MPHEIKQERPDQMQRGADPERPKAADLPAMPKPRDVGDEQDADIAAETEEPRGMAAGRLPEMAPFEPATGQGKKRNVERRGEMRPRPAPAGEPPRKETYLRLRVRAAHDRMTIVGAHEVEGPLTLPGLVLGDHVYEAMLDGRPVSIEGLADLGHSRSLARPGEREHHFAERSVMEFNVRIPRAALPGDAVGRLALTLFRLPDGAPRQIQGRVADSFGPQAETVAHVDALSPAVFAPVAREQIRRMFPAFGVEPDPSPDSREGVRAPRRTLWHVLVALLRRLLGRSHR